MEHFLVTITAQPGKEGAVADFYLAQQPEYEAAKGFRGRQIFQSRPGAMLEVVRKFMTPEQIAGHPEGESDGSVQFIIIEKWDTTDDRMAFSMTQDKSRNAELIPNLKPEHSHEYYTDISPK